MMIKLSHGTGGFVQLRHEGEWESVCDDSFGQPEAEVICRQVTGKIPITWIGHGGIMPSEYRSGYVGGSDFLLDDLNCYGFEATLFDCPHSGLFNENCGMGEDAWVMCEP